MKGNKLGITAERAIKHMIGQSQANGKESVTLSEIALWLNVSKPTAKRFMDGISRDIEKVEKIWRFDHKRGKVHSYVTTYKLPEQIFRRYEFGIWLEEYKIFVNQMYGKAFK